MTTTEANDLRAAREHAALLRDLEALCAKYAACNRKTSNATDFAHQLTDDPAAAGITYIAGPMTGYADHNYPAFNAMAKRLRDAGLTVINPAEIHPDTKHPWDWYLRRDITELVKCARVVFLNGWSRSRGGGPGRR
ncbi:DUF4406 domain-containing protein [Mycobacterium sp. 1245801.1]|uniref:DUF4406 domain-containing protein n=1 Tax=Mycobacterium sp. 1245801.1 TaxID=1834075 RepID=UPI0009F2311C|nr:DUF4406 domain-containing protein [Mycobacterium sp. 1245801.1]